MKQILQKTLDESKWIFRIFLRDTPLLNQETNKKYILHSSTITLFQSVLHNNCNILVQTFITQEFVQKLLWK